MDYLRTLGSAAVSSLVQKSGLNLPFTLGPKVASFGFCTLYDATKRDDSTPVSIFEYDLGQTQTKNLSPLAKNSLRKLRTLRHPDVLKFMDAVETDTTIHIMTERVRPLGPAANNWSGNGKQEKEDWLVWGLHRISVALAFVNDSCGSTHGNVRSSSIFISPSGEWKLGGFEVLSNPTDEAAVLYTLGGLLPDASEFASPEIKKSGWSILKENPSSSADAYALALLLHTLFNPTHPLPATTQPPHPPPQPSSRGSIPQSIFTSYKKLLNPNAKVRMSVKTFLEVGMAETMPAKDGGFFVNNRLVKVCSGLDSFALGSEMEKTALLRTLNESATSFPPEFSSYRVLPSLVSALEFGGASASTILPLVLQLGKNVPPDDYPTVVLVPLIKLYASPDRGTRMALLDHLSEYADKLDKKSVVDKIWPYLQTGFTDTVAVIREATVKAIILLAPKLNDRIMNNDLLRHLAKMQMDPEASIRTNTCILIGRLGPSLGYNTKRKVLVPAFSRALKDSFVHARVAGLMAFMASVDVFDVEEMAGKVVPNIAGSMIDKEKLVRDQAFKAVELFVKKLESHAATMPETVITENGDTPMLTALPSQGTLVNSAAGAAGVVAGWAISSLGMKLATVDMLSTMNTGPGFDRPTSAPPPFGGPSTFTGRHSPLPFASMATSTANSSVSAPTVPRTSSMGTDTTSKTKGMQLGASKVPASVAAASLVAQLEEEAAAEDGVEGNPWGTDDLIDINADEGDWSAFESAPMPPTVVEPKPVTAVRSAFNDPGPRNGLFSISDQLDDPWEGMDSANRSQINSSSWNSNDDPWQGIPTQTYTHLSTQTQKLGVVTKNRAVSITSSLQSTPISSPPLTESEDWAQVGKKSSLSTPVTPNLAGMSKEDKATEMARRKEERRQRIALLKEQKKTATGGKS